jgi:hypothetical protein
MPLQSIIVVILRLFAIQWGVSALISVVAFWGQTHWRMSVFPSVGWLVAAVLSWLLAKPIALFVTKGYDTLINFGGLTRQDLYSFSFVFIGLGFFLRGVATTVISVGVMIAQATAPASTQLDHSLVNSISGQLPRNAIETILGLIAVLFANRWAKKLTNSEQKNTTDAALGAESCNTDERQP